MSKTSGRPPQGGRRSGNESSGDERSDHAHGGGSSAARVTALGRGAFHIERADGTRTVAYGVTDGQRTWVFIDGVTHVVERARRGRSAGTHDASALAAPMPATVTQIHVTVGQTVAAGDLLVTLEAMKMELPIRANTSGSVASINCRVGELVQPGTPLVDLREEPGTRNREPEP